MPRTAEPVPEPPPPGEAAEAETAPEPEIAEPEAEEPQDPVSFAQIQAEAILAVLRGGYLDMLITDEDTAQLLLEAET